MTKAVKASRSMPRQGRSATTSTEMLVQLPGGGARITIEADAGVRRTASSWLRLIEHLAGTSLSPDELRAELGSDPASGELTPTERDELAEAGAHPASNSSLEAARGRRVGWQVVTLAGALDVAETAQRLGVDPTRIRQRLRDRTLYGLRPDGRSWRLPRFQFDETGGEIPHLGEVLRALPPDLHPRSVQGFLTTPTPELSAGGTATAPRDWLHGGGCVEPVVALAAALAAQ